MHPAAHNTHNTALPEEHTPECPAQNHWGSRAATDCCCTCHTTK